MKSKLPEVWKEVKLEEVVKFKNGRKAMEVTEKSESKYPLYGGNGQYGSTKEFNAEDSLVIGRVGAYCGSVHKVDGKFWISDNAIETKPKSEEILSHKYLYYRLDSLNLNRLHQGTSQPLLNQTILKNINIRLPSLEEQKVMADTLSALDDKIQLNNKINENLEQQAQAIFKHWFIDFEFPDENGNPYKSSGGQMIESELGMIPKGWEVGEINNYFNIGIGRTPPRKKAYYFSENKEDMTWVSISDLGKAGMFISESKEKLTGQAFEDFNIRIVPEDCVLMSFKLTIGRLAIANRELTTNEAIAHFINKEINMTQYLYLYLKVFEFEKLGNTSSIGTAINSTIVKKMPFLKSNKKSLRYLNNVLDPIFAKIKNLEIQNQKLSQLRDTLLPKLMNGEIRIPLD